MTPDLNVHLDNGNLILGLPISTVLSICTIIISVAVSLFIALWSIYKKNGKVSIVVKLLHADFGTEPATHRLRITNHGTGTAHKLKIIGFKCRRQGIDEIPEFLDPHTSFEINVLTSNSDFNTASLIFVWNKDVTFFTNLKPKSLHLTLLDIDKYFMIDDVQINDLFKKPNKISKPNKGAKTLEKNILKIQKKPIDYLIGFIN